MKRRKTSLRILPAVEEGSELGAPPISTPPEPRGPKHWMHVNDLAHESGEDPGSVQ
ncbi:hypothetical protein ACFY5D_11660 [Paeniglutamicibacter sp. NPDC012692]|uniref:hypothetical protein n=1 Tax=Paeniglutamicibacter sp. NPDC012692 TaxID=3364388 RepID=UPI0036801531